VRELTDYRGVDCVVEIGGPGTIAMSLTALAVGGHVSLIGASLSQSGAALDADWLRHYVGRDQCRKSHRFRGDEPRDRDAPLAPVIDRKQSPQEDRSCFGAD
jgi:NADPH:quinone reductase-like Zn-dependent oxidoreductase